MVLSADTVTRMGQLIHSDETRVNEFYSGSGSSDAHGYLLHGAVAVHSSPAEKHS